MYLKLIVLTCKNVLASLSKGKWRSWNRARSYVLLCKRAELASIEGPVWGYHSCCRGCKASSQCSEAAHWAGTILICLGAGFQRFLVWEVRAVWAGQGGSSTVGEGPRSLCKREQWFANLTWIWGWAGVYYKSLKHLCCGNVSIVDSGTAGINCFGFSFVMFC